MSVQYLPQFKPQFLDQNGNPLSNGKVLTYKAGTTTPLETYIDPEGTTANTNPVILDAAGRADIYLIARSSYKITVTDENDVPQYTVDNVKGTAGGSGFGSWLNILDYGADPTGTDDSTAAIQAAIDAADKLNVGIYAPTGTYRCTATITEPTGVTIHRFRGIKGDGPRGTIFDFFNITSGDAFKINNPPQGSIYEDFQIIGPGVDAPFACTAMNFVSDGLSTFQGVTESSFKRITVISFPTDGFRWEVPYVDIMESLIANTIGRRGFFIDYSYSPSVAGTSTNFSSCWALLCYETGFWFEPHVYSALNSCAADHCPVGYRFSGCSTMIMNGCGYETGPVTPGTSGIGVLINGPSGISGASIANNITGLWTYNFSPTITSFLLAKIDAGSFNNFDNCYCLHVGPQFTEDVIIAANSNNNRFTNCVNVSTLDTKIRITDNGFGNAVYYGGEVSNLQVSDGITVISNNQFGNAIDASGSITIRTDNEYAALAFYNALEPNPRYSLANDGFQSFGIGTTNPPDTYLNRSAPNTLRIAGAGVGEPGNLVVTNNATIENALTVIGETTTDTLKVPGVNGWSTSIEAGGTITISTNTYGALAFYPAGGGNQKMSIANDGIIAIGAGGASPVDVLIGRTSARTLDISADTANAVNVNVDGGLSASGKVQVNNFATSNQTLITGANIALTGWDTSTILYVEGGNAAGSVGITAAGTPTANPVVRVTFQSPVPPSYSVIPSVIVTTYQGASLVGYWQVTNQTATFFEVTFVGTPVAGFAYGFNYFVLAL